MKKEDFLNKYEEVMGVRLSWRCFLIGMVMTLGLIAMCMLGEFFNSYSFR